MHALAKEGFFSNLKRMIYHHDGQRSLNTLICATSRLFDPEFESDFWHFTTHADQVGGLCNIIATMLEAVVLLVVHDVQSIFVFIRKDLFALVKVTNKQTDKFSPGCYYIPPPLGGRDQPGGRVKRAE